MKVVPGKTKKCCTCGEVKLLSEFYPEKRARDRHAWRCKVCKLAYDKQHHVENREKHSLHDKQYYAENSKERTAYRVRYNRERRWRDPGFRLADNLRTRLNHALRCGKKYAKTMELIGCTLAELKVHLEGQFLPGMSWANYGRGGWDTDHIIGCASFDLTDPAQQRKCFHYTNLQPMWHLENVRKK